MKTCSIRLIALIVVSLSWCSCNQALATFHVWDIVEAFSSSDGSVQFVEMFSTINNQHLANTQNGVISSSANSFAFPTDLPSSATANERFLVGTSSYDLLAQSDPNVPLPDYVVVDNFFSTAGDTLELKWFTTSVFDSITFTGVDLPTDGTNSLNHAFGDPTNTFFSATNSPTNFAGDTGSVNLFVDSADFDEDNDVDGEDFLIWQKNTGGPGGLSQGDANNDGNVDQDDLVIWENQHGSTTPLAGVSAIPEPHAICLLLSGLLAICGRRRRIAS